MNIQAIAAAMTLAVSAAGSAAAAEPNQNSPTNTTLNVNVVNTPTVNVGSMPAVTLSGSATVKIGNTSANPVPSLDVEKLARIPYQSFRNFSGCGSPPCGQYLAAIPNGYRLVVQH